MEGEPGPSEETTFSPDSLNVAEQEPALGTTTSLEFQDAVEQEPPVPEDVAQQEDFAVFANSSSSGDEDEDDSDGDDSYETASEDLMEMEQLAQQAEAGVGPGSSALNRGLGRCVRDVHAYQASCACSTMARV